MASGTFKSLSASLKSSIGTVPSGKTVQGQIDSLNSNFANPTKWADWTEFTPTNSEKWNVCAYTKVGKIAYMYISVKGLTANTNTSVYQLPDGVKPLTDVHFCGFGGNAYLNIAHFYVNSQGVVMVASADSYAQGFIAYPTR